MAGHIAHALWSAAGCPFPDWQGKAKATRTAPAPRPGVCALTGVVGAVFDAHHVVSDTFTEWDRFPLRGRDPQGLGFGPAAAWVLRHKPGMQRPHVLRGGTLAEVGPLELFAALTALPGEPGSVVSVPTSGQKHVLAWAEPGAVRTDTLTLRWTPDDVARLGLYAELRRRGFGETALSEPVPRWAGLGKLPGRDRGLVVARWAELDPWRAVPAYLDVAARATRTPKETGVS